MKTGSEMTHTVPDAAAKDAPVSGGSLRFGRSRTSYAVSSPLAIQLALCEQPICSSSDCPVSSPSHWAIVPHLPAVCGTTKAPRAAAWRAGLHMKQEVWAEGTSRN